ncbi:hypothetical protein [Caballeronia sp. GAWG2-1]|uniref:hypothetical protein n=1 Tax=Caballeronia sp. GAWG2-1 TaxID=2921744 RepID=UPI002029586F|nr:hypothetical protein [Caballeronia sp. GAWG2-1]
MTFSSCLTDQDEVLVLDASVIINLLATGHARGILNALHARLLVTEHVVREIGRGAANSRREFDLLSKLTDEQVLKVTELSALSLESFFDVVSGSTSTSLGDGEAATLALAHCNGFSAAIDEKKATRIAGARFGSLKLLTTVDILAYESVRDAIGHQVLADATYQALRIARMQVWEHQFDWVVQLIGLENAAACPSLKRHMRRKSTTETSPIVPKRAIGA